MRNEITEDRYASSVTLDPQIEPSTLSQAQWDIDADVVIIGAGITGVTAAYLLKKAGKKVILIERGLCARVDTAHTTAHLTYVTDSRLSELVKTFGREHAQAAWEAGRAAMDQIRALIDTERIDCDYRTVPGYLHASWNEGEKVEIATLKEEASLANELGFEAVYSDSIPFAKRPGIRFANQGKFHPLRYLAGLLPTIPGGGSHVFEHSEVSEFQTDPLGVKVNDLTVRCKYIIIATHVPLMGNASTVGAALFQSKLVSYSSYAIGAKSPKGSCPEALFSDTSEPYYYLRFDEHPRHDYAIFGVHPTRAYFDL